MVTKKRKSSTSSHDIDNDNDSEHVENSEVAAQREVTKYVAGKNPRRQDFVPVVYDKPLHPNSELYTDANWNIPEFNMFISFTIDNLIDLYRPIFKDFIKLPSRKFHPQYYYKVEQPMSLKEIKSRDFEYNGGCKNFLLDLELLAKNCNSFNEEDSLIVKNSYQVVNYVKYEVIKAKNAKRNYLLNNEVKQRLMKQIEKIIDSTEKEIIKEVNHGDKSGRNFKPSEPFLEFVDEEELPEYYEVIHKPMALNKVKENLEENKYVTIYDCVIDIMLTFDNAQVFNDEESPIYEGSELLLKYTNHLLNRKFFPELQDAKERGEIALDYDKLAFTVYNSNMNGALINRSGESGSGAANFLAAGLPITSEADDYDFNHFEGLGNGYTKNLLTSGGDYLLGPNSKVNKDNDVNDQNKRQKLESTDDKPEILKFNILKSLQKTFVSKEHQILKEPFRLISQISVSSSHDSYQQTVHPMTTTRPPHAQNWLQYTFELKEANKHENMYTISVQPNQTLLTLNVSLNIPNLQNSLELNRNPVASNRPTSQQQQEPQLQTNGNEPYLDLPPRDGNENKTESYDLRLLEGMNRLEFKSNDQSVNETFNLWINVLP
ncbi:chromatin structure-remodeling complex subunit Rsc4p [Monosporozyma servazzii]